MQRLDDSMRSMTMREAWEKSYPKDELAPRSHSPFKAAISAWERFTDNPDVSLISNRTVEEFRNAARGGGLGAVTTNKYWGHLRSVLRRVGPPTDGNPWALDLFPGWRVPAMRPCKVEFKRPRRLGHDELNRAYLAARHMKHPVRDLSVPTFFWQALLVVAYNTGLRCRDLLAIRWSDINTDHQTLYVKTQKTGVEADLPLHAITMAHLSRLPRNHTHVFPLNRHYLYQLWNELCERANVNFGLHDIRRTACSDVDSVDRGLGKYLLLHASRDVTEKSYLNSIDDLRPAIEKMEWPTAFKHGTAMAIRAVKQAHKRMTLRPDDFSFPVHPPMGAFKFTNGGFVFMGRTFRMNGNALGILKTLMSNSGRATQVQLWEATDHRPFPSDSDGRKRLYVRLVEARKALKELLSLPTGFNPIVATSKFRSAEMCHYELFLPPALWQSKEAS